MDSNKSMAPELPKVDPEQIRPGEIWEISREVQTPIDAKFDMGVFGPECIESHPDFLFQDFLGSTYDALNDVHICCLTEIDCWHSLPAADTHATQSDNGIDIDAINLPALYPEAARSFLKGHSPSHYVMIVKEPEPAADPYEEWRMVSVMLLSVKTDHVSDVDLLIPSDVSGVGQDLLAETWHVLPMLTSNLSHPVGQRLSREIYDVLLDVGDYYHGLLKKPPTLKKIRSLGLRAKKVSVKQPKIQAFHRQEEEWAAVLEVPVAAYRAYLKAMKTAEAIFDRAVKLEQKFFGEKAIATLEPSQTLVHLSRWFQKAVEEGWYKIEAPSTLASFTEHGGYGVEVFKLGNNPYQGPVNDSRLSSGIKVEVVDCGLNFTCWESSYDSEDQKETEQEQPIDDEKTEIRSKDSSYRIPGAGLEVLKGDLKYYIDGQEDPIHGPADNDLLLGDTGEDILDGGIGNDFLSGYSRSDKVYGGLGSNTITGGAGQDELHGNEDADFINGDKSQDTILGDTSKDTLNASEGNDTLYGENGNDRIIEDVEQDTLFGNLGRDILCCDLEGVADIGDADYIRAGDGNDEIHAAGEDDTVAGDAGFGNDTILGCAGSDLIYGRLENDLSSGGDGSDSMQSEEGEEGKDSLSRNVGNDSILGNDGNDLIGGGDDSDTIQGNEGDDRITGDAGNDSIEAGDGEDSVSGGENQDTILGQIGDDRIFGDSGEDSIQGGNGEDTILAGSEADSIQGEADNDQLFGNEGNDTLYGHDGDNIIASGHNEDTLEENIGNDQLFGDVGNGNLHSQDGEDILACDDNLFGGEGSNNLLADELGEDILKGGTGNDILGNVGNDWLYGEVDNDVLEGDVGKDFLYGSDSNNLLVEGVGSVEDELQEQQTAKQLGEIAIGHAEAIDALATLISTTQDDETLWTSVESLWQLDPNNPAAGIKKGKLIKLGQEPHSYTVALTVTLIQKPDGYVGILFRLYPTFEKPYLLPDLKLILLDELETTFREVTARDTNDAYLQLKLSGLPGEQFSVRIALEHNSITEKFLI